MDTRPLAIVPFSKGSSTYRVKRYRERAEELRAIAEDLCHPECQQMLIRLATSYDEMAASAEHMNPLGTGALRTGNLPST
jgi:hypothetical protein